MKQLSLILFSLLVAGSAIAQNDTDSMPAAKTEFLAGISYNSALNYYGRVDSLKSRGIYPFAGILFKNGLYVASTIVLVNNAAGTKYAASIVEGGYRFDNEHWSGNLSASQFFYSDDALVQSAIHQQLAFSITNINRILHVTLGTDVKFSNQADLGVQAGLDHPMQFGKKVMLLIDPSLYAYAGTQNFTRSYLQQQKFLLLPGPEQVVTANSRRFNVLSYEISCPLTLAVGKMNLVIAPAYVLPQNLITVPGRPELSERAGNMFYATTTLRFKF